MPVVLAKLAGFCYGVRNAVRLALNATEQEGQVSSLGPLMHNPHEVRRLSALGIRVADSVRDIGTPAVVIRSHGVSADTYQQLSEGGVRVVDATCPHVRRIHRIVSAGSQAGKRIVIIGDASHPEVRGIAGWAGEHVDIVYTPEEALALPEGDHALVVVQTTLTQEKMQAVRQALAQRIHALEVEDTICDATEKRQQEARQLAQEVDAMLVVGGRNSANTRALYETVRAYCPRTLWIEQQTEIPPDFVRPGEYIGITAGASTPDWLLKEVTNRMNDMERQDQTPEQQQAQDDFMADIEATLVKIRPGQTVTGTVVQISDDEVCVNIGYKSDGLIKRTDLIDQEVAIGDEIEVEVVKVNDGEGNVVLSQRNVVNRKNWDALMEKYDAGEFVEGVGKEAVKGGLIADVNGVRAFIPASQLSLRYVERIDEFVGKEMTLKIIEVDKAKKRVVASYKAYLLEQAAEKKKEVWARLAVGDVVHGIVRRLTDFGAFVDIGGVDGLVHVTDLSWGRVKHSSDIVSPNQEIDVVILSLDPERERIQLGYKQLQKRPWDSALEKYPVGDVVEGKVVRITTFGAFVELEPGLDGLVHISQVAPTRIAKVEDAVQVGQMVNVRVLSVDPDAKRISLSIRDAMEDAHYGEEAAREEDDGSEVKLVASSDNMEALADAPGDPDEAPIVIASEKFDTTGDTTHEPGTPAQSDSAPANENPARDVAPSDAIPTPDPQDPPAVIPVEEPEAEEAPLEAAEEAVVEAAEEVVAEATQEEAPVAEEAVAEIVEEAPAAEEAVAEVAEEAPVKKTRKASTKKAKAEAPAEAEEAPVETEEAPAEAEAAKEEE